MKIAMLAPIAWSTPPSHYGPWESVVSLLTEGLVAHGIDVTLFATGNSRTRARLSHVCARGYAEDPRVDAKVCECLHIAALFEQADQFDLIHNHFDFLPLTYIGMTDTPVVTTIHGFSSPRIVPVYEKYNDRTYYVAISQADAHPALNYIATIHHGIDLTRFTFRPEHGTYLLFFGRIHPDKGAKECIAVARQAGMPLVMAGIIQDRQYFETQVRPLLDGIQTVYAGSVGPLKRDELLGNAYALLHPINFAEPFGLSVIEAMACGTPVIALPKGSMPEVIDHGVTGFLAPDLDAMAAAVAQIRTLDRADCRRHVEARFSVDRMVRDYLRVYRKILGRTHRVHHRPTQQQETPAWIQ